MHASFTNKSIRFITIRENHRKAVKYLHETINRDQDTLCMVFCDQKYLACQLAYKKQRTRIKGCTKVLIKEQIKRNFNSYLST